MELLDLADVGDRLAGLAPDERPRRTAAAAPSPTGASGWAITPVRSIPRMFARRTSASRRGVSEPAARRRSTASRRRTSTVATRSRLSRPTEPSVDERPEALGLVGRDQGVDEAVELAVHDPRQVREVDVDPVVGHPVLREVVGPDLVGPVARPDHRLAGPPSRPPAGGGARRPGGAPAGRPSPWPCSCAGSSRPGSRRRGRSGGG